MTDLELFLHPSTRMQLNETECMSFKNSLIALNSNYTSRHYVPYARLIKTM